MPDMRFAPPPSLRIGDGSGGLNQISVRSYNERLVMSLLLQHNGMSRIEMGRISGLSAQTISVIVRGLERDGMISRGEAQRGRVGPPTIPMCLNPEGAFSVGADVGQHSIDVVLIDFVGSVRYRATTQLVATSVSAVSTVLDQMIPKALSELTAVQSKRLAGIGLTLPDDFDQWEGHDTAPDFETQLQQLTGQEVFIQNQVTAAAGAVSMFEQPQLRDDYLFCLIGPKIANRLILDHRVYVGAAPGSQASAAGIDGLCAALPAQAATLWQRDSDWPSNGEVLETWISLCGETLAQTLIALRQFANVNNMIIASHTPETIGRRICAVTQHHLDIASGPETLRAQLSGLGTWVSAIGSARLPFHSRFMVQGE